MPQEKCCPYFLERSAHRACFVFLRSCPLNTDTEQFLVKFLDLNFFSPFAIDKHISSTSHDLPTFGAPAKMYRPCAISPSMTNSIGLYTVVIISSQDLVMSFFTLPDLLFYFQVSVIVTEHSEIYIQNKKLAKTFKIFTSLYYSPSLWYRILIRLSIVMVHFHCFAQKI